MSTIGRWEPGAALAAARSRLPLMLSDARALVETESPSGDLRAIARSAQAVRELVAGRLTVPVEVLEQDGVPHVRVRPPGAEILLLAHHDTVWPIGTLASIPCTVRAGIMRGPGSLDMKVGLVQAIHALAILGEQLGSDALAKVELLVTGDEETGSATSRALIESDARGMRAALVMEAAAAGGALKVARKGAAVYRIEVTGRASHAGLEPESGVNAALELAHQALVIAQLGEHRLGTTVTPTTMSAGTTANTVPGSGTLHVDVRTRTVAEQVRVERDLRALTAMLSGALVRVHGGPARPPFERSASADLFGRWGQAARRCGVHEAGGAAVGGASDGNLTAALGVPTLDGLGAVGGGAHAADEHVEIAHIPQRAAVLATLMADLLGYSTAPGSRARRPLASGLIPLPLQHHRRNQRGDGGAP